MHNINKSSCIEDNLYMYAAGEDMKLYDWWSILSFLSLIMKQEKNLIEDIHMEGLMAVSYLQGGFKYSSITLWMVNMIR